MSEGAQKTFTDDSVQIVLIGATGSGKSSSGNTILGNKHFFATTSAKSITLECQSATVTVNGRQVTVVDTPGWDCTELSEDEVAKRIRHYLQTLHGPYSFLLVIRIGSEECDEVRKIYKLREILGSSYLQHTTILFSHIDNLEWETIDEFLEKRKKEFKTLLEHCSGRYHSWNNRYVRCVEDVEKILQDLKKTELDMKNLVNSSKAEIHGPSMPEDKLAGQESKKAIQVLFLGRTKVGKTSSIKTLLRKCEKPEKNDASIYRCYISGLNLALVESPGFDDNEEEIGSAISTSLSSFSPGPHVIIIVMSAERFTPATKRIMKLVRDGLGQSATNHTMILFTRRNDLGGKTIETFISENTDLQQLVNMYGNRFHALENRDVSDQTQVDKLLKIITDIYETNGKKVYKKDPEHQDSTPQNSKHSTSRKWAPWK